MFKVLIISPFYSPGFKAGGPIKSITNIVNTLDNKFDFDLITLDRDKGDESPYQSVSSNHWNKLNGSNVFYISPKCISFRNLYKLIKESESDIIYLNSLWSVNFSFKIVVLQYLGCLNDKKIFLAPRGELSRGALSIKKYKKKFMLYVFKTFHFYQKIYFHATCEQERDEFIRELGIKHERVFLAKNIPSTPDFKKIKIKYKASRGVLRLVFISRISPKKNLHFAIKCLSRVDFSVELDVFGPIEDALYWRQCEALIKQLPSNVKVEYKGVLHSSKVSDTFLNYHAFLFPTLGENYGHVIVEALLVGTKVIISNQTPWRDLRSYNLGYDLPLEESEFLKALSDLNIVFVSDSWAGRQARIKVAMSYVGVADGVQNTEEMFNNVISRRSDCV